jgi:predicted secreted protein
MSRQADLERLLGAWYDLEGAHPSEKDKYRRALDELLDAARAGSNISRQDLIQAMADRYRVFKATKDKEMRALLARLK